MCWRSRFGGPATSNRVKSVGQRVGSSRQPWDHRPIFCLALPYIITTKRFLGNRMTFWFFVTVSNHRFDLDISKAISTQHYPRRRRLPVRVELRATSQDG